MQDQDLAAFLDKLPQLHERLGAAGIAAGTDAWLAVHDLLLRLARQGRLPPDPLDLAFLIGPILCQSPEQQRHFPDLYAEWWTGRTPPPRVLVESGGLAERQRAQQAARLDRRWVLGLAALLLALLLGALAIAYRPLPPPPPSSTIPAQPKPPVRATPPPKTAKTIPIIDQAPPNRLPEPRRLPPDWQAWLDAIGRAVPWLPALPVLGWLAWRYRRSWALSKGDPDRDSLAERLRLRPPRPLFGGEGAGQPLQRLRAGRWLPTRTLDMDATVAASVRSAGFFEPRYRARRESPHYLVLVRSRHTHDQGAAMAEELIARFAEHRLSVEGFRFSDDPSRLVPWTRPGQPARSLARLARQWPEARLIVVSEGDILLHPVTGRARPWVEQAEAWPRRAWMNPGPLAPTLADELWRRDFLVLPLAGGSLEPLSHWLADWAPRSRARPPAPAPTPDLPAALERMPDRWLDAAPPYGEDLPAVLTALRGYLEADGWLLLQAVAAYPEARWNLTRALDYLLFEHRPDPADPPQWRDARRREERLGQVGRLPWVRQGHLPDYLREALLEPLAAEGRRRIGDAYGTLLDLPATADGPGVLVLPIARPRRRKLRRLVLDSLRPRRRASTLDDPLFLNVLLGDRLSLLDFHLPRALARLLPGGRWRLNPWPGLLGLLLTAGLGYSAAGLWESHGRDALAAHWHARLEADNAGWPVTLRSLDSTRELADALATTLAAHRFMVTRDPQAADATRSANRIQVPPGAEAAAARLAGHLRHLSYVAPAELEVDPMAQGITVVLLHTYGDPRQDARAAFNDVLDAGAAAKPPLSAFRDPLKDGGLGPDMIVLPGGRFTMGSPETEKDRDTDEGPQREVTVRPFAIGRTEVSFDDYDRFARATGRKLPEDSGWGRGTRPVINVSWKDAAAYAEWLSAQTGQAYRLPTEAEWEYAIRAGTATAWFWGADESAAGDYAWYGSNADGKTQEAGRKRANAFGLYDTAGNVWEWTADCSHKNYQSAPVDGSAWLEANGGDCGRRVVRGGSWYYYPGLLRSAFRFRFTAGVAYYSQGFRVARAL